jgi:hypothetical protein
VDDLHFDWLTKLVARDVTSRRSTFRVLAGTLLGGTFARFGAGTAAAACRSVGARCRRASNCCSGVCRGPDGKQTCRAHDVGACRPELDFCLTDAECSEGCICLTTTGRALFCARPGGICAVCERDRDCLELGFPTGSACIRLGVGRCANSCAETGGTICMEPCDQSAPA